MICPNCNRKTYRLIIDKHGKGCAECRGLSEAGGTQITHVLTRNSERVRAQQHTYEGDTITPHIYDRTLGRLVPNEDFMRLFPGKIATYFTEQELHKAGYSKPDKLFQEKAAIEAAADAERDRVEFVPDTDGEGMASTIASIDE